MWSSHKDPTRLWDLKFIYIISSFMVSAQCFPSFFVQSLRSVKFNFSVKSKKSLGLLRKRSRFTSKINRLWYKSNLLKLFRRDPDFETFLKKPGEIRVQIRPRIYFSKIRAKCNILIGLQPRLKVSLGSGAKWLYTFPFYLNSKIDD